MIEIFYDLGVSIYGFDKQNNSFLHILARLGDAAHNTLKTLLDMRFNSLNSGGNEVKDSKDEKLKKVFPTDIKNKKGEMPIHIAAKSKTCQHATIQLLAKDLPSCFTKRTANSGSLPIHIACQFTEDPALLATLLYFDKSVVNAVRPDGLSPLHLVAGRKDIENRK